MLAGFCFALNFIYFFSASQGFDTLSPSFPFSSLLLAFAALIAAAAAADYTQKKNALSAKWA